jgi:Cdc6-like AAA superfamily ATPase
MRLGEVFSPAAPIDRLQLFAGRSQQRSDLVDAILQRGRHAILFGERGVGKTSLATTLQEYLEQSGKTILAPRVNCDDTDTFTTVWRKVFNTLTVVRERRSIGFTSETQTTIRAVGEQIADRDVTPEDVRVLLNAVGAQTILIVIVDEFDRITGRIGTLFSDTIKTLSDHSTPATVVLVGVADTVEALIRGHESIERALAQLRVPRMSRDELTEIMERGLTDVGMTIEDRARDRVLALSQGLPHYTHLVTLYAARSANKEDRDSLVVEDVQTGIAEAVKNAQESIIATHHRAIMSSRRDSLYRQVALACALAETDERGYFTASAVRKPMTVIMGKHYDIAAFARHMNEFCGASRGPILSRIGVSRNYRFRFINPLLQPFVIMDGISKGLLTDSKLGKLGA